MKARICTCGFLMAVWQATIAAQADVVASALAEPPALTESAFLLGVACLIPHLPGFLILGVLCAVFRNACYIRGPFQTATSTVFESGCDILFRDHLMDCQRPSENAASRARGLQTIFVGGGGCALLANGALTGWMIWAEKPAILLRIPENGRTDGASCDIARLRKPARRLLPRKAAHKGRPVRRDKSQTYG